jgi:hypothetical protein
MLDWLRTEDVMHNDASDASLLTEDAAKRLIARALQLQEAESAGLRVEHIRHALSELGISDRVFLAALDDTVPAIPSDSKPSPVALGAATIGIGLGAATTTLVAVFPQSVEIIPLSILGMAMVSGGIAVRRKITGLKFQLANASLWSGFAAACAMLTAWAHAHGTSYGFVWEWQPFAMLWVFTSAAGLAVSLALGRRGSSGASGQPLMRRFRTALAKGLRWLTTRIEPHFRNVTPLPR